MDLLELMMELNISHCLDLKNMMVSQKVFSYYNDLEIWRKKINKRKVLHFKKTYKNLIC